VTYSVAGEYAVSVEVVDDKGTSTKSEGLALYAGNETPEVKINLTGNKTFYFPGKQVAYDVQVMDKEDAANIKPENMYIRAEYMEGNDQAAIPQQGHQIITGVIAGKNLFESGDCKTCHKLDEKSIGPAFKLVAEKYKDDPNAKDYLANKIISGGGGVWGETAMSAHPTLTQGEAHQLAEYVMSQGAQHKVAASLPQKGTVSPTAGKPEKDNGILYLIASYTDQGGPNIRPLTGTATATLRSPKLVAANYDQSFGVTTFEADGIKFLIPTASSWVSYNNLDLTGVSGISISYFTQEALQYGYNVQVFLDKDGGTKLGEVLIGPGAKIKAPNTASISFAPVADGKQHNLYIKITAANPEEKTSFGISRFELLSK